MTKEEEELRQYWRELGALARECERELQDEELTDRDRKTLDWLRSFGRLCRRVADDEYDFND